MARKVRTPYVKFAGGLLAVVLGISSSAIAQTTLYWNPTSGGSGAWDTITTIWRDTWTSPPSVVWDNVSTAVFRGGTTGVITVHTGGVAAKSILVGASGESENFYMLSGGQITLSGTSPHIFGVTNSYDTLVINSVLSGDNLFFNNTTGSTWISGVSQSMGSGSLILTATNALTGTVNVGGYNQGSGGLCIKNSAALGTATIEINGNNACTTHLDLDGSGDALTISNSFIMHGRSAGGSHGLNLAPEIVNLAGSNTISNTIEFATGGVDYVIQSNSGKLTITGNITNPINSIYDRYLYLQGAAEGEVTGTIGGTGAAIFHLIKDGSGTWTLSGSNTYSGDTTINNGALQLGSDNALPYGSGKGNLYLATTSAFLELNNYYLHINGLTGTAGSVHNSGGDVKTLTLGNGNANGSYAGTINGNILICKVGTGAQTFSGTNSYSGQTSISGGTLMTNHAAALPGYDQSGKVTVNAGATLAVRAGAASGEWSDAEINTLQSSAVFNSGALLGIDTSSNDFYYSNVIGGSLGLSKLGSNTLILTASNTYTGGTIINTGTLKFYGGDDRLATTGAITLKGGVLDLDFNTQHTSGNVNVQGGTVRNGAIVKTGADYEIQAGTVSAVLAGSAGLSKTTTGTATLSASNSYSGGTTITDGTLILAGGDDRLATTGAIQITSGVLDLGGNNQHTSGEVIFGGDLFGFSDGVDPSGDVVFQGGTVQGGTITHDGNDYDGRYGLVLADLEGSAGLTKTSTGTLTLCASNSYLGGTTIKGGVLSISILANGGANSGVGQSSSDVANLVLNGGALQYTGPAVSIDRAFKLGLGASAGTLDASGSGALNLTYTGSMGFYGASTIARTLTLTGSNIGNNTLAAIIGDASDTPYAKTSLVKSGLGAWVLTASNTFTGGTIINAGVLKLSGGDDRLAATGAITLNGGVLDLDFHTQHTSGNINFQGGAVQNGTIFKTGADYDFQAGVVSATLAGSVGLTKTSTGTVTLSASNSYIGGTAVNAGAISVSADANLGAISGKLTLKGGTLLTSTGFSMDAARPIEITSNGGAIQVSPDQTLTLPGSYTLNGGLSVTGGGQLDLSLTSAATLSGSGSLSVAAGTTLSAGGAVDPFTDGVNSAIHAAVANDGQFNVTSGIKTTGEVTGSGATSVTGAGTQLSVSVLHQSQLSIGADARLTIRGVASAPLSEGMYPSSLTPVPEPSTWALLLLAATGLGIYRVRQKGQSHFC